MNEQFETTRKTKLGFKPAACASLRGRAHTTKLADETGLLFQWPGRALVLIFLTALTVCNAPKAFSQVGIGTTTPDASAILDLSSTTKGFLISRVTLVQRNAIVSPATGLLVYQTDNSPGYYYNEGTPGVPNWVGLFSGSSAGGWDLSGNAGTTVGTHFLGTTDAQDLAIYTNNAERIRVNSTGNVGIGTTSPVGHLHIQGTTRVDLRIQDADELLDEKIWDFSSGVIGPKTFGLVTRTDAGVFGQTVWQAVRSGTTVSSVSFPSGSVGVGMTAPTAKLHVTDGGTSGETTLQLNGRFKFRGDGVLDWGTTANSGLLSWDAGRTIIGGQSTFDLALYADGNEKVRVTTTGRVGIGTTTPGAKLEVFGGGNILLKGSGVDAGDIVFQTSTSAELGRIFTDPSGGEKLLLSAGANVDAEIVIQEDGNVGIGTSSPQAALDVSSTASGVLIPRVTLVQRNAIVAPVTSELVFQTDNTPGYYYWDGTAWVQMLTGSGSGSGWSTTGNAGTTVGTNFLGTTDAQDFALNTNNLERFRVASDGKIGIGTTTPTSILDIRNASAPRLKMGYTGAGFASHELIWDGTRLFIGADEGNVIAGSVLNLRVDGTSRLWIEDDGFVGLSRTSPQEMLDIDNPVTTSATNISLGDNVQSVANSLNNGLMVFSSGTTTKFGLKMQYTGSQFGTMMFGQNGANSFLSFGKVGAVYEDDDMIEYMRVDLDNGNVGIGTPGPVRLLHVGPGGVGTINTTPDYAALVSANSASQEAAYELDVIDGTRNRRAKFFVDDATGLWGLEGNGSSGGVGDFIISTNFANERLRITNTGNVGIGTTTPSVSLDVIGATRTTGKFFGHLNVDDTRAVNDAPTAFNQEVAFEFKTRTTVGVPGSGTFSGQITLAPWGDNSGDAHHQLNFNEGGIFWRQGQPDAATWGAWTQVLTAGIAPTGSGTLNFLPKWTPDGATLGNSLVFDNGTNVGIGTTTPNTKLQVAGEISTTLISNQLNYKIGNDAALWDLNVANTLGLYGLQDPTVGSIKLGSGGPTISGSGGNVGIGTTSPEGALHIVSASAGSQTLRGIVMGASGDFESIELKGASSTLGGGFIDFGYPGNDFQGRLIYGNADNAMRFYTATVERVHITSTGNVGIGTSTPTSKLAINSTGAFDQFSLVSPYDAGGWARGADMKFTKLAATEHRGLAYGLLGSGDALTGAYFSAVEDDATPWLASQLFLHANGNVGIGTTSPTNKLHVNGKLTTNGTNEISDIRWKKDIEPIETALAKVLQMRGVHYYWRISEFPDKDFANDRQIGVIAQEVEKIVPELVETDSEGWKSVQYSNITALLIEGMKEQQKLIESLQAQLKAQKLETSQRLELLEDALNKNGFTMNAEATSSDE
ncbi:MAG: tail fiber domain-containing protein [Flavobacteriales bacterium]|nr:tail fiber domain-containing protein [Flavobacteriales bacterium]